MRHYYQNTIPEFIHQSFDAIWAQLTAVVRGDLLYTQKQAWAEQITILKAHLVGFNGDFRYKSNEWGTYSFVGRKWQNIKKEERKMYLKNAYRVLLTRARQGMVIVVSQGNTEDPTRKPEYYDSTYKYLKGIGIKEL